ncbi:hypothetical protein TNCV_1667361 [Trichonephila clavipes]|nr:hypothetical protein TNCV_1667361 [Trichonephila clavipes]
MDYTIEDIKSELEDSNHAILDIQRFTKKKKTESGFKPIKTIKVTQIGCTIPERVPIGSSNRQKLGPIYNAALRLALGLPRNTPLEIY